MASNRYPLTLLEGAFAVCRLGPHDDVPGWAGAGPFSSVTRTAEELSIVCAQEAVPPEAKAERGWRAFKLEGPIPFQAIGVVSGLTKPLADAGISVFVVSTFDTDYLLVKDSAVQRARKVLDQAGFHAG